MSAPIKPVTEDMAIKTQQESLKSHPTQFDGPIELTHREFPDYPRELLRQRVQGVVEVLFLVDEAGRVEQASIITSPQPALSEVSLAAIRKWRFKPITKDGVAVKRTFRQRFPFRIGG